MHVVRCDAHLARNRVGRNRVIAGDHDDADTGALAGRHGGGHIRAHGVFEADQAEIFEIEVVLV